MTATVTPTTRRRRELAAVAVALAAGLLLVVGDLPGPAAGGTPTLAAVWPAATIRELPAALPSGDDFEPLLVLDAATTVGVGSEPGGERIQLLRVSGTDVTTLRSLPAAARPRFVLTPLDQGRELVWAESTVDPDTGPAVTIWHAGLDRPPVPLTDDTGAATFFGSQYDLVVAEDRVHWVASAPEGGTELRSVARTGGPVSVTGLTGQWALNQWPWLVSVAGTGGEPLLRRVGDATEPVHVAAETGELATCAAQWCRVLVPAQAEQPTRIELRRPDGGERRLVAGGGQVSSPLVDVALLDRFEVWTAPGATGAPVSNQRLLLYDLQRQESVQLADGVGRVGHGNGFLWWSTGSRETLRWHALDLTTLP